MTALLSVNDLHVSYGKVEAVTGVSLEMQAGQIVTVIGPNGAGKTTLLAALMGLLPSKGESRYEQGDIGALQHRGARAARHLPRAGAARAVHRDDGQGQPASSAPIRAGSDRAAVQRDLQDVYARFPRLAERSHQLAGTLSGGEMGLAWASRGTLSPCRPGPAGG